MKLIEGDAMTNKPEPPRETPDVCQNCHQAYGVWFVANEFWNLVIAERTGMLCPNCFIARAERAAIKVTGWQLVPENFAQEPTKEEFAAKKCSRCEGETPSAPSVRHIISEKERLEIKTWIEEQICDYRWLPELGATTQAMFLMHKGRLEGYKHVLDYLYERDKVNQ